MAAATKTLIAGTRRLMRLVTKVALELAGVTRTQGASEELKGGDQEDDNGGRTVRPASPAHDHAMMARFEPGSVCVSRREDAPERWPDVRCAPGMYGSHADQ